MLAKLRLTADKRLRCYAPSLKLPSATSFIRKTLGDVAAKKGGFMKKYLIRFFVLAIAIMGFSSAFAQGKKKIPADFFIGRWTGKISVEEKRFTEGLDSEEGYEMKIIYLIIESESGSLEFTGGLAEISMREPIYHCKMGRGYRFEVVMPNKKALVEIGGRLWPEDKELTINIADKSCDAWDKVSTYKLTSYGGTQPLADHNCYINLNPAPLTFQVSDDRISITGEKVIEFPGLMGIAKVSGELHRVRKCEKKDKIHLNTILSTEYNDEIKTFPNGTEVQKIHDKLKIVTKDGCVELYIKEYFKITGSDGTEMEISVSKVLDGIVESNIYQGYIQVDIRGNGKHHHFFTKDAIVEVSGTNFTMEVSEDGTTILTVLDGEVEFSDKQKRKTVVVKKSQISVVNPGGLPSEPVSIDPRHIPKWWEEQEKE